MNTYQQSARVGVFFIVGVALVWATFETLDRGTFKFWKEEGYVLVAGFKSLKDLKSGNDVRMAGVNIGSVETTMVAGNGTEALAYLRFNKGVVIRNDAVATIAGAALIPANYISIDLGTPTAPALKDGDRIKVKDIADLSTVMDQLSGLGSKLDSALGSIGDAFKGKPGEPGLFQRLDKLVAENDTKFSETITNLRDVTKKINEGDGTIGKLVNDATIHNDLVSTLNELKSGITDAKNLIADARPIIDQVKSGKGTLGTLIYDDTAGENIKVVTKNLRDVSEKIARGEGSLGLLLNDDKLAKDLQSTVQKAGRALDGLEDAGPINAVGVVAKSLF